MKEDSDLFLIDTNILVYAFSQEQEIKNKKAKALIDKCWDGFINLAVSNQNLAEFVFVSTKKSKLSFNRVKSIIEYITIFRGFKKINYSEKTIHLAIDLAHQFQIPFWDSLLAATMKENNIFNIYRENTKDFKIKWINAVNPLI